MSARLALLAAALFTAAACGPRPAPAAPTGADTAGARVAGPTGPTEPTGPSEPAGSPKDSLAAAVERSVEMLEAIAVIPSTLPCPDAAARIDRLVRERAADRATVHAAIVGDQRADVDALYEDASGRLADVMVKIDALAARCAADATLTAALGRVSTEGP